VKTIVSGIPDRRKKLMPVIHPVGKNSGADPHGRAHGGIRQPAWRHNGLAMIGLMMHLPIDSKIPTPSPGAAPSTRTP